VTWTADARPNANRIDTGTSDAKDLPVSPYANLQAYQTKYRQIPVAMK
jgi:hypothetical protein